MDLTYQSGFGNHFSSEAAPGALPVGQNSPQRPPFGLYAEQLSGTAFTAPRHENRRSWLYRLRPSAGHGPYAPYLQDRLKSGPFDAAAPTPNRLRWDPLEIPAAPVDFVDGLVTIGGNGDVGTQAGMAAHLYLANRSMIDRVFQNADGELLIVPQQGALRLVTEFGRIEAAPGEIVVIPRGVRFRVRAGRPGARLCLRKLRRGLPPAGAGAHRLERPGQQPRLPDPGRRLRGHRAPHRGDPEVPGRPVDGDLGPQPAGRGRVARQPRAVQVRPGAVQHDQHRQLRSSRSVDLHRADLAQRRPGHAPMSTS
jgi:hypothetical protein